MKLIKSLFITILFFGINSCQSDQSVKLFNGENLDNWIIYTPSQDVIPEDLFWVEEGIINVSGIPNGYIRTKEIYSNFKLHVEWRWLEEPENSGVLLHVQGGDMLWPNAIECQLRHKDAGDIVLIGKGAGITINDSIYRIDSEEKRFTIIPKFEASSENPAGEWNHYDIVSRDGELEVRVNGIIQNVGTGMTLTEGNILIQSEGGPMQFRNIFLIPLK